MDQEKMKKCDCALCSGNFNFGCGASSEEIAYQVNKLLDFIIKLSKPGVELDLEFPEHWESGNYDDSFNAGCEYIEHHIADEARKLLK